MEPYIPVLLALLGGSGIVITFVTAWLNRRRSRLDTDGIRDGQVVKWRDDALQLSEEALERNRKMIDLESKLHDCLNQTGGKL